MAATRRLCRSCDGDGRVVDRVIDDPFHGWPRATTIACPDCGGTGWELVPRPSHSLSVLGLVTLMLAIAAAASLVLLILSAPRPGPQSTGRVDLSPAASAEGLSGAPRLGSDAPQPAVAQAALGVGSPLPESVPAPSIGEPELGGWATWYDAPTAHDAAAGPALRDWLGPSWRGAVIVVSAGSVSLEVRLTDSCPCGGRDGQPTLLDLDDRAFASLASLSSGVVMVTITGGADPTLPPTDGGP